MPLPLFRKGKYFLTLYFSILLVASFSYSQESKIKILGSISDSTTNEPIAHCLVCYGVFKSLSDGEGHFSLVVPFSDTITLNTSHVAYTPESIVVFTKNRKELRQNIYLKRTTITTPEVLISSQLESLQSTSVYSNKLFGKKLQRELADNLAFTLRNQPGVAIRSMGPAPARPVIRGMSSDRVVISEDNNKSRDLSGTSPDHAVTVESFTMERVEFLRGPKVLTQSSSTLAGIINVVRNEIASKVSEKISGTVGLYGETVNSGVLGGVVITVPFSSFMYRGEYTSRKTGNTTSGRGEVLNTSINTLNYSNSLSYINSWWFAGVSWREYESDYGIPGGFVGGHPNGVDISMKKNAINGLLHFGLHSAGLDMLEIEFSSNGYRHIEYEKSGSIGAEFVINDLLIEAKIYNDNLLYFTSGVIGSSFYNKDLRLGGYVFTPPSTSHNFSLYTYQEIGRKESLFSFAARLEHGNYQLDLSRYPGSKNSTLSDRDFTVISASASYSLYLGSNSSILGQVSRTSRIPTVEELFSEGPHLAAYSYEIGNPKLSAEYGYGAEVTYSYQDNLFNGKLSGFYNYLPYYIIPQNTGRINYQTLLAEYQTQGTESRISGFELSAEYKLHSTITLSADVTFTEGVNLTDKAPLPMIPPVKSNLSIEYLPTTQFSILLRSENAFSQGKLAQFEEKTAGYSIISVNTAFSFNLFETYSTISLNAENLLNKEYFNHLSRIKSVFPESGRNVKLILKTHF